MSDSRYRPDIDGLRAIAVLMVLVYHAVPSALPGGFIGVDVFFVISGYLISGNVIRDIDRGVFTFLDFYARRFRRIVPALAVVLAVVWAPSPYLLLPAELTNLARHIVAGATFTTNLLLWKEAGYFDAAAELKPLLHLWSLGVEEQFYLLWPPILLAASAMRSRRGRVLALLLFGSFALNVALVSHFAITAFYMLPTRLWELLIGGALAHWQNGSNRSAAMPPRLANAAAVLAIAVLVGVAFVLDAHSRFPGWWALAPTLAAAMLIATGERAWAGRVLLSWRPAVLIGLISYPLYLWHYPLLAFGRILDDGNSRLAVRLALAGLSVIFAWLTWRLVERPIQKKVFAFRGSRRLMAQCVSASLACLATIATIGWTTRHVQGYASRSQAQLLDDLTRLQKFDSAFPSCSGAFERGRPLSWCFTAAPGDPEIAIFGDSHAYYLFPGFADVYRQRGINVLVIGETACPPLADVRSYPKGSVDQCVAANTLALQLLSASRSVKTVVLASLGPYYFSGASFAADHTGVFDAANWVLEPADGRHDDSAAATFARGLSGAVSQLEAAGKRVVLFIDVPELDFRPEACVEVRPIRPSGSRVRTPCGVERSRVIERQAAYRGLIAQVAAAHPTVRVFDSLKVLCDGDLCSAWDGHRLLYRDSHHVSVYGSELLASRFGPWLHAPGTD